MDTDMYEIVVDWAPAYELLASIEAYARQGERKTLELGAVWARGVRARLSPDTEAGLAILKDKKTYLPNLLAWLCPGERDADSFIRWLGTLSPGDLFECLAPYLCDGDAPMLRDLGPRLDRWVGLLAAWNEQYFRHIDSAILDGLRDDAATRREMAQRVAPTEMVEIATGGIHYAPAEQPRTVLLSPQYHYRPWNLNEANRDVRLFLYPCDALPPAPGEPAPGLMRLTNALSDASRLRILRYLAGGRRSFTEIVGIAGLTKGTVHYHLVLLRAAGLVRVHDAGDGAISYSLRPGAVDDLNTRLGDYLMAE